jgi:inositol hexakisphosphate
MTDADAEQQTVSGSSINLKNPLSAPYRTGSYLVYDVTAVSKKDPPGSDKDPEHFRSAWSFGTHPYPASGSHQLDATRLVEILKSNVIGPYRPRDLFLVDLREETHGFLDGRAASWYADNDFGNVGQSPALIERDEEARLGVLAGQTVQVFTIANDQGDNRKQQRVMPMSYEEVAVRTAGTERQAFDGLKIGPSTVHYVRIPVTDHCGPSESALAHLRARIPVSTSPADAWVHFHCHGGDGRTTTFLALYDMLCWRHSKDPLPPGGLDAIARRQCLLFWYCLKPNGCKQPDGSPWGHCALPSDPPPSWKPPLEKARWQILEGFLRSLTQT